MRCLTKSDKTIPKKIKQPHFLLSSHSNKMIMIELPLPPQLTTLPPPLRDHHTSATIPPHKPWATPCVRRVRTLSARLPSPRTSALYCRHRPPGQPSANRLAMPLIRVSRGGGNPPLPNLRYLCIWGYFFGGRQPCRIM
jgi:hypothetical protein